MVSKIVVGSGKAGTVIHILTSLVLALVIGVVIWRTDWKSWVVQPSGQCSCVEVHFYLVCFGLLTIPVWLTSLSLRRTQLNCLTFLLSMQIVFQCSPKLYVRLELGFCVFTEFQACS